MYYDIVILWRCVSLYQLYHEKLSIQNEETRHYFTKCGRFSDLYTDPLPKYQNQNVTISPLSMNAFQNNNLGENSFCNNFNFWMMKYDSQRNYEIYFISIDLLSLFYNYVPNNPL